MSARIRVRCSVHGAWRWQLITLDDHVANESEPFASRAQCEADALKQGLPVIGMAKQQAKKAKPASSAPRLEVHCGANGLWTWRRWGVNGEPVESACAFLTKEECVLNAREQLF